MKEGDFSLIRQERAVNPDQVVGFSKSAQEYMSRHPDSWKNSDIAMITGTFSEREQREVSSMQVNYDAGSDTLEFLVTRHTEEGATRVHCWQKGPEGWEYKGWK